MPAPSSGETAETTVRRMPRIPPRSRRIAKTRYRLFRFIAAASVHPAPALRAERWVALDPGPAELAELRGLPRGRDRRDGGPGGGHGRHGGDGHRGGSDLLERLRHLAVVPLLLAGDRLLDELLDPPPRRDGVADPREDDVPGEPHRTREVLAHLRPLHRRPSSGPGGGEQDRPDPEELEEEGLQHRDVLDGRERRVEDVH